MKTLLVPWADLFRLRRHLLRDDGLEYQAYALARRVGSEPGAETFRVEELFLAEGDDYRSQGRAHIHLAAEFQLRVRSRVRETDPDLVVDIHSHPFTDEGWFSSVDDRDFPEFVYDFTRDRADRACGRWVWGRRIRRSSLQIAAPGGRSVSSLEAARFGVAGAMDAVPVVEEAGASQPGRETLSSRPTQ